eukprot:CAMPEP_0114461830 /NCGR_PEP_ID=MMETSP0104-20121206/6492_1 /TAXON_ID=37642 ORGANISM="Paraphysomonas imperforata, Strain PA2" /NCGR_SAMPLE_ID=MMETSP0104 /ASSEMBLY_ACC=CAM_ASM_000202 /LENGTH=280 /DNA_ID=CAMNT_0001634643 /DNA_START=528 /DNA_END=1368 /DNA_ORIENTATION=-
MKRLLKAVPGPAFRHWKRLTFNPTDLTDLLNRIRLRKLREHFDYMRDTADGLVEARMLAGLQFTEAKVEPPPELIVSEKKKKPTRKAPLDNMHTSCDCVSKVCHGHRPTCSFKLHFRRRLHMCFEEYDSAVEDKNVAKMMNKFQPSTPIEASPLSTEPSPSAFEGNINAKQRVKKVPMSPERKRRLVREKVRGGVRVPEPLSHWPSPNASVSVRDSRRSRGSFEGVTKSQECMRQNDISSGGGTDVKENIEVDANDTGGDSVRVDMDDSVEGYNLDDFDD